MALIMAINVGCNTSKLNTTAKVVTPEMRAVIAGIVQEARGTSHSQCDYVCSVHS